MLGVIQHCISTRSSRSRQNPRDAIEVPLLPPARSSSRSTARNFEFVGGDDVAAGPDATEGTILHHPSVGDGFFP